MKVLVTGHRGFIGQNMVQYLKDNTDWEVDGWEWGDSSFPTVQGYNWVIHLGAISSTTEQDVEKVLYQNTEFSKLLFRACQINYVNLQYSSSASVYGLKSDFKESSPCVPQNPYAWSKYLFERWVKKQGLSYGCKVHGFRYFNVYGNHEEHKGNQASPITQFRNQTPIKLFDNSKAYLRDFVAVEDVCRIHVDFIKNVKESGVWNVGTGKAISFQDVADLISNKQEYIAMPDVLKNSYQIYTCADLTKLESTIGLQEFITVKDWLSRETD